MRPRRILLLARDMVGDLVNTTGAMAWIRNAFPDAEFVLEGGPAARELFPSIEVWVRKRHGGLLGKLHRIRAYKAGRFSLGIVLDDSKNAAKLARAAGIPQVYGPVIPGAEDGEHDLFSPLAAVLRLVAAETDVEFEPHDLAPVLPGSGRQELQNQAPVVLHVSASDIAKTWPEERWIELAQRVDCAIAGGPGDESVVERIAAASGRPALPSMPLLDYAEVIQHAKVIVTGDTGPAHLAAAVGTRAIVLYGPTDPDRFHPWGTNWVALRHPMGCEHYGRGCAFKQDGECTQQCMRAIEVNEVLTAINDQNRP